MSLARYLSKLGALLTSDGKVPAAALAAGAARANFGAGAVLQVVYASYGGAITIASTTLVDIVSATITPSSATSKILMLVTATSVGKTGANVEGWFGIYKNGSGLVAPFDGISGYSANTATETNGSVSCEYLDSPATTSAITYTLKAKDDQSGGLRINWEGGLSSITLLEIAA